MFDFASMKLTPSKVFISGATGKLGRNLVIAFAKEGARICINYHTAKDEAEELLREVKSMGCTACISAAVRGEADIEKIGKVLGGLDILINSAGIFRETPLGSVDEDAWDELMNVNCRDAFFLSKYCAKYLRKARPGRIINIADTYGASPSAGFVPYGISKAGVIAMTKGLAKELSPDVLVNCVCPGVIEEKNEKGKRTKDEGRAIGATLLKRPVYMRDVVDAVMFLARSESIAGQAIFVDGGKYV